MTTNTNTNTTLEERFADGIVIRHEDRPDVPAIVWSATKSIPAVGSHVLVRMNGLGAGLVTGYHVCGTNDTHGFLGLLVKLLTPPEWYVKQTGNADCTVFGTECEPIVLGGVDPLSPEEAERVAAFRREAAEAGDTEQAHLCRRALAGDGEAIGRCLALLHTAASQE